MRPNYAHVKNNKLEQTIAVGYDQESGAAMNGSKLNRGMTARLSRVSASDIGDGAILVMVGSYAPAHEGHVAAMTAALAAIESSGEKVACLMYVPNGDSYVSFKLHDAHAESGGLRYTPQRHLGQGGYVEN